MQKSFAQAYFLDFAKRLDIDLRKQMKMEEGRQTQSDKLREEGQMVVDRNKRIFIPEEKQRMRKQQDPTQMKINPNPMGQKKFIPPPGVDERFIRPTAPKERSNDSIDLQAELVEFKMDDVSGILPNSVVHERQGSGHDEIVQIQQLKQEENSVISPSVMLKQNTLSGPMTKMKSGMPVTPGLRLQK